jgi:hypothetical protein
VGVRLPISAIAGSYADTFRPKRTGGLRSKRREANLMRAKRYLSIENIFFLLPDWQSRMMPA